MREIKFRAKHDEKEWIYGDYVRLLTAQGKLVHKISSIKDNVNTVCLVDPVTIGQYTGFNDCNDKEIYEGDIIHSAYNGIFEAKWNHEVGAICLEPLKENLLKNKHGDELVRSILFERPHKIIGNIHEETKELKIYNI